MGTSQKKEEGGQILTSGNDPDVENSTNIELGGTSREEVDKNVGKSTLPEPTTTSDPNRIGIGCEGLYAPSVPDNGYLDQEILII